MHQLLYVTRAGYVDSKLSSSSQRKRQAVPPTITKIEQTPITPPETPQPATLGNSGSCHVLLVGENTGASSAQSIYHTLQKRLQYASSLLLRFINQHGFAGHAKGRARRQNDIRRDKR